MFRLIHTPCCKFLACWVNPRLPNFCPECGARVYMQLKTDPSHIQVTDNNAILKVDYGD